MIVNIIFWFFSDKLFHDDLAMTFTVLIFHRYPRYVAVCVSDEATTTRRAYSSIQWFLYVFVLEIKLYFVCQNYRNNGNDSTLARKLFTLSLSICVPGLYVLLIAADRLDCLRQLAPTDTVASIKDEEADEGNDHSCESPTSEKCPFESCSRIDGNREKPRVSCTGAH